MYFKNRLKFITIAILSVSLTACVTPTGPVNVTRFNQTGTLNIDSNGRYQGSYTFDTDNSLSLSPYNAAINREMQKLGFKRVTDNSGYIISVKVDRYNSQRPKNSNVSVGGGASTGSFGSGIGLGLGINLSGNKKRTHTELAVRISKRSNSESIWEGRAVQSAKTGSPAAQEGIAASKLASALFEGFPGVSGSTITVP